MIDIILVAAAFAILTIGSFTDFKKREVPDWVNYAGIVLGIGIRLIYSVSTFNWNYIIEGIIGFAVFFLFALAMFYLGQWGGGDSKMLMGLGALIGIPIALRPDSLIISFIVNGLIVGAVYGLVWGVILAVKHRKKFISYVHKLISTKEYKRMKKFAIASAFVLVIISFFAETYIAILIVSLAVMIVFVFYSWAFLTSVEKSAMIKNIDVDKLTEGDWIVKDVFVDKKRICGPKDLGISKKQIRKLVSLKKKGKIRKVLIKEGMPFVPVFLISYAISVFAGNLVLMFV